MRGYQGRALQRPESIILGIIARGFVVIAMTALFAWMFAMAFE